MTNDVYLNFCKKIAEVLSLEKLQNLHELQRQSLNNQLQDLLESHDNVVETITKDEIIGRYELVTLHIYPNDFVELNQMFKNKDKI